MTVMVEVRPLFKSLFKIKNQIKTPSQITITRPINPRQELFTPAANSYRRLFGAPPPSCTPEAGTWRAALWARPCPRRAPRPAADDTDFHIRGVRVCAAVSRSDVDVDRSAWKFSPKSRPRSFPSQHRIYGLGLGSKDSLDTGCEVL